MKRLATRLAALEGAAPERKTNIDLDAMSDADLYELEDICVRLEALADQGVERSAALETLTPVDLSLIARLPVKETA